MHRLFPLLLTTLLALGLPIHGFASEAPARRVTVLAVNDIYRIDGVDEGASGGIARIRSLRRELEREDPSLLVLHAGDLLFPSMLSRRYNGAQMIDMLNRLDGDADAFDERLFVVFGNHEFEKSKAEQAPILAARVDESRFTWVNSNVQFVTGGEDEPVVYAPHLQRDVLVDVNGVKVGLFGLTTDVLVPEYVSAIDDPVAVAEERSASLRARGAELVIGLTHLDMATDRQLLEQLGERGPDIIFGGHEHFRQSAEVDGRLVVKADADARTATVARIDVPASGRPAVTFEFRHLDETIRPDAETQASTRQWMSRFQQEFCAEQKDAPNCLTQPLGRTAVKLVGEELQIRSIETNLGNWVADQALEAFRDQGAQIALINSGSLRLNQDLLAGSEIARAHLAELFAFPSPLFMIRISGETLHQVLRKSIDGWPGHGRWLQVAGLAFVHDSVEGRVDDLTLLGPEGPRAITPDEELLVVTSGFLLDPSIGDQDGYRMLNRTQIVDTQAAAPDLVNLVVTALVAANEAGIDPAVEGRICNRNAATEAPCLAIQQSER
ncbi:bifunctional metallophosphatase/5'-nucleotidase [Thiorhodovibrio frisius]|uniref:5'-nucleotidase/2',3'-cyclic phosphodiesterase-like hydrolase n=1 Tax=Thiorhodovibrio frisius TaxID=631362 RepID=H8Z2P7_9GAMM|nr:bifunctional metallophosphatase/5'-nucleotidase [Thiorhodovibrio frisius]EIC22740.1 5'-nucleotidase/2',3'-cyclic phosphodiesterase-like hydrolase [Thiorhodovibrio frisius]WPL22497.1 Trifunctional nucleotide phosphoesterase protein YfkN precursor [Thiorhodovibrio frisius]